MPPEDTLSQASHGNDPHGPIPEDWLSEPVDVHQVEEDLAHEDRPDGWLQQWSALLRRMQPGDELWEYGHSDYGPEGRDYDGRSGYAVVRDGRIVDHIGEPFWSY
jgi:hypothetical protein